MLQLVLLLVRTCMVVSCHNRQSKQCGLSFYRFPKDDKDLHRRWMAFVSKRNPDGSAREPGMGNRVCSEYLYHGKCLICLNILILCRQFSTGSRNSPAVMLLTGVLSIYRSIYYLMF